MNKMVKRSLLVLIGVAAFVGIFIYVNNNLYRFFAGTTSINVNMSPTTMTKNVGEELAVSVLMSGQEIHATDIKLIYDSDYLQYYKEYTPDKTGVIITDTLFETTPVIETVSTVDTLHKRVRAVVLSKTSSIASQGTLGFKFKTLKAGTGTITVETSTQITGKDSSNNAVSYTLNITDPNSRITINGTGGPTPTTVSIQPTTIIPTTTNTPPDAFLILDDSSDASDHIDILNYDSATCTDNVRSQIYVYDSRGAKNIGLMKDYSLVNSQTCWSGNYPEVNKVVSAYMFYGSPAVWRSKGLPQYIKFRIGSNGPLSEEIDLAGGTVVTPTGTTPGPTGVTTIPPTVITPKPTGTTPGPTGVTIKPTGTTPGPTGATTIPPTVITPKPTGTTPGPTVIVPTDVTIQPTDNPSDPNASQLNFTIRFQGVTKVAKEGQRDQKVRITLDDGTEQTSHIVDFKGQADGTFKGTLSKVLNTSAKYTFLIKGPKHITKKICTSNPTEQFGGQYRCKTAGSIVLKKGANDIDLSKILLLAGDLPEQNGLIDSVDLAYIRQNFGTKDADKLTRGDLNMDGIIDSQDFALIIAALGFKYDED